MFFFANNNCTFFTFCFSLWKFRRQEKGNYFAALFIFLLLFRAYIFGTFWQKTKIDGIIDFSQCIVVKYFPKYRLYVKIIY